MTDTPTTKPSASEKAAASVTAPPAPPEAKADTARRGVYVVYADNGDPVTAYSAEIKAMRRAMAIKGTASFVTYGDDFSAHA